MPARAREISGNAANVKWDNKKVDVVYIDADTLQELWEEIFAQAAGQNIVHVDSYQLGGSLANRFSAAVIIDTKGGS